MQVLLAPKFSEKATRQAEKGAYFFRVSKAATKPLIKEAVEELYGVRVRKVNLLNAPARARFSRGKVGHVPGYKKALVFLKAGERIEVI